MLLTLVASPQLAQEAPPPAPPQAEAAPDPDVNEAAVRATLKQLVAAEAACGKERAGKRASILELILARRLPGYLRDGEMAGYRFRLSLSDDQRGFFAVATPLDYGRSGRRSFFADKKGVRGEDLQGQVATSKAPLLEPAAER